MLDFFGWCFFGLIAGGLARFLMPGRYPMGCIGTILLGIGGSIVGGFIGHVLLSEDPRGYHPGGWLLSILGGVVILALAQLFTRPPVE